MSFDQVLQSLTPEIIVNFKQSLELGKWPDGRLMTSEQKALCMEAVLKYEAIHQIPEAERLGYIDRSGLEKRRNQSKTPTNLINLMKGED